MSDTNKLDVLVFGATGYTGELVCEYLHNTYGDHGALRWGMAGRNRAKLEAVRDKLNIDANIPLVLADSADQASVDAMVSATRVLLTTAGPYQQYGSTIVEACARLGTDYVDLNGEPLWMKAMVEAHDSTARASGARIVFSCGFDSLPSDLGVQFLQEQAIEKLGAPLPRVKCRVKAMRGAASGGTVASFTATMAAVQDNPALLADLTNSFALTGDFQGPEQPPANEKIFEEDLNSWSGQFVMATINTKNVHRSNYLLDHAFGQDLVYDEMVLLGETLPEEGADGNDFGFDMSLQPGEGPSAKDREEGFYNILFIGSNPKGDSLTVEVVGDRDPGYGSTSKMIAEAAICLAELPKAKGGCLTGASAMGSALRERLHNNAGVTFTLVD